MHAPTPLGHQVWPQEENLLRPKRGAVCYGTACHTEPAPYQSCTVALSLSVDALYEQIYYCLIQHHNQAKDIAWVAATYITAAGCTLYDSLA